MSLFDQLLDLAPDLDLVWDLLFPPKCPFCGARVERTTDAPCPNCPPNLWTQGGECLVPGTHFARCVCAAWYAGKLRDQVRRFKFHGQTKAAKAYGRKLAEVVRLYLPGAYDCITWVPVSQATLKKRGYDQARLLASETAAALGRELVPLLEKTRATPAQSSLDSAAQRKTNVKGVYAVPDPDLVRGKRVLLIDDILTTGSTMEEAARTLRAAGAEQVVAAAFCRTPMD